MPAAASRIVLVTGAAGGIGSAITGALVAAGHRVGAVDRDQMALDKLVAENSDVHPIVGDLAQEADCTRAVAECVQHFGHVDAVINNAGIGMSSIRPDAEARHPRIAELSAEIWDRFYAINVRGHILITRAALPHMQAKKWGRIVNNTTSFITMLRVLPYGAMKSTLESISAVWAKELEGSGITVNVLIPGGPTDTPFISDAAGWPRDKMLRPAIMGPPAAWLISDEAAAFTGQRIIAARWDLSLRASEAAQRSSRAIGWPELTTDAVWLQGSR
ncbi:MAG TPA: SDR family oxidoreductase [Pseudolabrys sp.]|nr:SDR family oxidoreductase [Pseudolabrys sp.]